MPSFVSLITSRLAGPILGSALLISLVGNGYQFIRDGIVINGLRSDVSDLQGKNDALRLDNATLKTNNATLQSSITNQNAAIDGLKAAADLSAANSKAASAAAAATAAAERTTRVAAISASTPGEDRCASASELIRTTLASEHKQ